MRAPHHAVLVLPAYRIQAFICMTRALLVPDEVEQGEQGADKEQSAGHNLGERDDISLGEIRHWHYAWQVHGQKASKFRQ